MTDLIHPFPERIVDGHDYLIGYDVPGETRLEAVSNAVNLLRSGITLNGVFAINETSGGFWHVTLHVHEAA